MPAWLRERVPWASEWRFAATEVIDLRGKQLSDVVLPTVTEIGTPLK